jgi:hypothetical protein
MRCHHKNCGGLIVKQIAYGPYPERLYCQSCGREPKSEDPIIEKFHGSDRPKGDEGMSEATQTKECAKCETEKSVDEFGILRSSKDGRNPVCFDCKRKRDRDSRTKVNKPKVVPGRKSRSEKQKSAEALEKKIIAQHEESAEAQLINAFKKTTINSFIKDDLIPMLERIAEEKFGHTA